MSDQPFCSLDPPALRVEGKKSRGAKMTLDATIKKASQEWEMFERVKF